MSVRNFPDHTPAVGVRSGEKKGQEKNALGRPASLHEKEKKQYASVEGR